MARYLKHMSNEDLHALLDDLDDEERDLDDEWDDACESHLEGDGRWYDIAMDDLITRRIPIERELRRRGYDG